MDEKPQINGIRSNFGPVPMGFVLDLELHSFPFGHRPSEFLVYAGAPRLGKYFPEVTTDHVGRGMSCSVADSVVPIPNVPLFVDDVEAVDLFEQLKQTFSVDLSKPIGFESFHRIRNTIF